MTDILQKRMKKTDILSTNEGGENYIYDENLKLKTNRNEENLDSDGEEEEEDPDDSLCKEEKGTSYFNDNFYDFWEESDYYDRIRTLVFVYRKPASAPPPINTPSLKFEAEKAAMKLRQLRQSSPITISVMVNLSLSWVKNPIKTIAPSHVDGLRGIMDDQKPLEAGWTMVEKKSKDQKKITAKQNVHIDTMKSRLCVSFVKQISCPNEKAGNKCNFAHNLDELSLIQCRKSSKCDLVLHNLLTGTYKNTERKICEFLHPNESLENYVSRIKDVRNVTSQQLKSTGSYNKAAHNDSSMLISKLNWLHPKPLSVSTIDSVNFEHKNLLSKAMHIGKTSSKDQKEEGWVEVIHKKVLPNKIEIKERTKVEDDTRMYSKLCWSVTNKVKCPHKDCRYAHSEDKLLIKSCDFDNDVIGRRCSNVNRVKNSLGIITYSNVPGRKICKFKHQFESNNNFLNRTKM
jgi:hypothetical protein